MSFSDDIIKEVCVWCGAVNDIPVEYYYTDEGKIMGCMTNGIDKCWSCQKYFYWEMSKETIDRILEKI